MNASVTSSGVSAWDIFFRAAAIFSVIALKADIALGVLQPGAQAFDV
ncbi:hypothetical protein [Pseudomonas aeruginosa]|nr:hypothetical protein [Pseudomonas aeruginosa]